MLIDISEYGKYINLRKDINSKISRLEDSMNYIEFENDYASDELKNLYEEESKLYDRLQEIEDIIYQMELIKHEIYQLQYYNIFKRKV